MKLKIFSFVSTEHAKYILFARKLFLVNSAYFINLKTFIQNKTIKIKT